MFYSLIAFLILAYVPSSYASVIDRMYRDALTKQSSSQKNDVVEWNGWIKEAPTSHNNKHVHDLFFVNESNGKSYPIINSPNVVKFHCENEKNFKIKILAELTPKYLMGGEDLIVKDFKILQKSERIPHRIISDSPSPIYKRIGDL